jgi:PIN domain nuclease of toxin-antitoxin system
MNILLDTCALIWLVNGGPELSPAAKAAIQQAETVFVSAVTAWEMGLKHARGKLVLASNLESWLERALRQHHLREMPLDIRSALRASRLPAIHADPADRLLIASALEHDLTLLTPDPAISQYPGISILW